jgi:hypothetical protein
VSILDAGTSDVVVHERLGAARPHALAQLIRRLAFVALGAAAPVRGQEPGGLPPHFPINPNAALRSGLFAAPYRAPHDGWLTSLSLTYASVIENEHTPDYSGPARFLTDAEVQRTEITVSRDVSATTFLEVQLGVHGAYNGFADRAIDWFHERFGVVYQGRDGRPLNTYGDTLRLPDVGVVTRSKTHASLGDLRLNVGRRHGRHVQSIFSVTLPTSTGPEGYGRRVVSLNTVHTLNVRLLKRFTLEGSAGIGYTPKHGKLARYERELFASGSAGVLWRCWGAQSLYLNAFYHSPYYRGTTFGGLDNYELSLDFGWMRRSARGHEWRAGFTEDPRREDPAVDLVLMFGASW